MSGWFKVKRGITSHPIFKGHPERLAIWMWLLDNAAWTDTEHDIRGKTVKVAKGSVCASERRIAEEVGVGRQVVRTFLARLKSEHMINPDPTHGRNIITLCNWDKYQASQPEENPSPNPRPTQDQPTKEEGKNIPVGKGADAPSSEASSVVDLSNPKAAVWAIGKAYLSQFPGKVKDPGKAVGGLLKAANGSAADLIGAIEAAKRAGTQDPMPYLRAALKPKHVQERDEMRRVQSLWL